MATIIEVEETYVVVALTIVVMTVVAVIAVVVMIAFFNEDVGVSREE